MTKMFEFTLKGREWFPLWAMFWVPTLLLQGLSYLIPFPAGSGPSWGPLLLTLAVLFLQTLVTAWFQIPLLGVQLSRLSVGGLRFDFRGDSLTYTAMNAIGFLLSVVTLGLYLPWYLKRVLNYLAEQTSFEGSSPEFQGRPLPLLGTFVLWVVIMFVAVIVMVVPLVLLTGPDQVTLLTTIALYPLILLLVAPLVYVLYRWMVDYSWNGVTIRWRTKFWRANGMILGQLVLCLVTLGIYTPVACLRLYEYFLTRTAVERGGFAVATLSYDRQAGPGLGLCWSQLLLTVVTLGFYYPWALEKVGSRLAAATRAETPEIPSA